MPGAILNNFEVAAAAEWAGLLQSPGVMSKHMEIFAHNPDPDSSGTPNSILGHMLLQNKLRGTVHTQITAVPV